MLVASSSRTVPAVTSWPLSMTTTWLQTCSISDEEVAREQDGRALVREPAQQLAHRPHLLRVEAVRRLVEQQQLGPAEQHPGEAEPLAHALRVGLHPALDRVAEPGDRERAVEVGVGPAASPPASHHSRRFRIPERCGTNAACSIIVPTRASSRAPGLHPPAEQRGLARGRADQADEHPQRGGLARAVRTEQPADLALLDLEVEARDGLHAAVALREAAHGDHRASVMASTLGPGSCESPCGSREGSPMSGAGSVRWS